MSLVTIPPRCLTRVALLLSLPLLGLLCGAGCSSEPEAPEVRPVATFPQLDHAWREAGLTLDWVGAPFVGAESNNVITFFTPGADAVLVMETGTRVCCLEGNTGRVRWTNELANPLTRFVGLTRDPADANRVVASSETEAFALSVTSGSLQVRESFEKVVSTAPILEGTLAIYGTGIGEVLAHRLGVNRKAWGFRGVGVIEANPVRLGDLIAAVTQRGDVIILEPRSGSLVGRGRMFDGVATDPVVSGDTLYVASLDQSVWAFRTDGSVKWRYRTPSPLRSQPAVVDRTLVLDVPGEGLTALDLGTGSVKWINPDLHGVCVAQQAHRLLVQHEQSLIVIDPDRGDVYSTTPIPGVTRLVADTFKDGNVFAITDTNLVAKLRPS